MGSVSQLWGHQFKIPSLSPRPIKGAPQSSRVMERGLAAEEEGCLGCKRGRRGSFKAERLDLSFNFDQRIGLGRKVDGWSMTS